MAARKSFNGKGPGRPEGAAFVTPGSQRLPLWGAELSDPGAEWIEVKNQITYGDEVDMAGKILTGIRMPDNASDEEVRQIRQSVEIMLDVAVNGPFRILVWTVDWNLKDEDGKTVELSFEAVRRLALAWSDEINRLIDLQEEATGQGKARRKSAA